MTVSDIPERMLPFMERSWNQALGNCSPNASKTPGQWKGLHPFRSIARESRPVTNGGHEDGGPPAKRQRRVKDASPEDVPTVLADMSPHPVCDLLLSSEPPQANRMLRIDILKLVHKDSERRLKPRVSLNSLDEPDQPLTDEMTIRARCKIILLDNSPHCKHAPPVILCKSEECDVKTFKNPVGSSRMARIYLDQPFLVPEKDIKVVRNDGTYGLADTYRLDVELYGIERHNWPPLNIDPSQASDHGARNKWVLLSCVVDLLKRPRLSVDVYVHQYTREAMTRTSFIMDISTKWSTGIHGLLAETCQENGVLPSITVGEDPSTDTTPNGHTNGVAPGYADSPVNGDVGNLLNGTTRALSEEADGETTPNRSLRVRGQKAVYNLKVLSDKAQGKEKKRRGRGGVVTQPFQSQGDGDGNVKYMILPADEISLDSYRCILCAASHLSLQLLQTHLETVHHDYSCELRPTKGTPQFRVSYCFDRSIREDLEFGQFRKSAKALQLERQANGPVHPRIEEFKDRPLADKAHVTKPPAPKPTPHRRQKLPPKKILVPNTKVPLYDPVSRVRLEPGTELVPAKYDNTWWVQKQRDMVTDFSDIEYSERSYLLLWDSFCLPRRISTDVYMPQLWLAFLKENASRIVMRSVPKEEFYMHAAHLQSRDAIDQETFTKAMKLVEAAVADAKDKSQPDDVVSVSPKEHASRKCQKCNECNCPIAGVVATMECTNSTCANRFHVHCILDSVAMNPCESAWLCNDCASSVSSTACAPR